jgi:hypothetical protein
MVSITTAEPLFYETVASYTQEQDAVCGSPAAPLSATPERCSTIASDYEARVISVYDEMRKHTVATLENKEGTFYYQFADGSVFSEDEYGMATWTDEEWAEYKEDSEILEAGKRVCSICGDPDWHHAHRLAGAPDIA